MYPRGILIIVWALLITTGGLGSSPVLAGDSDGDGVDDALDVCNNTPAGAAVDAEGRSLGDLDRDCDTDLPDYALFQRGSGDYALFNSGFTGPSAPSGMAMIPAGEFLMGDSFSEGISEERPVHAVYIDTFYIDSCEVTNQQYADALNWGLGQGNLITVTGGVVYKYNSGTSCTYCSTTSAPTGNPHYGEWARITWNGTTFGVTTGKENHPMVMMTWHGSAAYANWRSAMQGRPPCYDLSTWTCNFGSGYRLPTEAEWEKAARGGKAGRRFPWSDTDTIEHARANYYSTTSYAYDTSPTRGFHPTFNTGVYPYTSPVGYFAANGYGLYDMAGNVWEWCNDWYSGTYYSTTPYPHVNPHGPTSGSYRVLRGGGWRASGPWDCRCVCRYAGEPGYYRFNDGGFRLALDSE